VAEQGKVKGVLALRNEHGTAAVEFEHGTLLWANEAEMLLLLTEAYDQHDPLGVLEVMVEVRLKSNILRVNEQLDWTIYNGFFLGVDTIDRVIYPGDKILPMHRVINNPVMFFIGDLVASREYTIDTGEFAALDAFLKPPEQVVRERLRKFGGLTVMTYAEYEQLVNTHPRIRLDRFDSPGAYNWNEIVDRTHTYGHFKESEVLYAGHMVTTPGLDAKHFYLTEIVGVNLTPEDIAHFVFEYYAAGQVDVERASYGAYNVFLSWD